MPDTINLMIERMVTNIVVQRFIDLAAAFAVTDTQATLIALDEIAGQIDGQLAELKSAANRIGGINSAGQIIYDVGKELRDMIERAKERAGA